MEFWQQSYNVNLESFGCHVASAGYTESSKFNDTCARYRHDYQIIYLHKGTGKVCIRGVWYPICSGALLFYRPMEYQEYSFLQEKDRELYWLYFDNISETEITQRFQIPDGILFDVRESMAIRQVFQRIIEEITNHYPGKELMLSLYAGQLLLFLSRCAAMRPLTEKKNLDQRMEAILDIRKDIEVNYMSYVKVWEYAARCGLSVTQFIHLFRKHIGMTPIAYRQKIRMENAEYLLRTTNKTVQEIATDVGFRDGLYFSKVFQKQKGMAPSAYRKQYALTGSPEGQTNADRF